VEEVWKPIAGFETLYEVSNTGRVRPIKRPNLILAPRFTKRGYVRAALSKNSKQTALLVHRLVATAFIGAPPSPTHQINHIDGNKSNNRADNLEWVTAQENALHAYERGLMVRHKGTLHGCAKLSDEQIAEIKALAGQMTQREIAEKFGVGQSQVSRILTGKRWGHVR